MDATSTSGLSSLESKIHALSELSNRVENLRQVPSFLLRTSSNSSATLDGPPANSEHGSGSSRLKGGLDQLKKLTGKIRTNEVQEALVAARDSEHKDKSGLELNPRRQDLLKHW